jgi:hypothetical protein
VLTSEQLERLRATLDAMRRECALQQQLLTQTRAQISRSQALLAETTNLLRKGRGASRSNPSGILPMTFTGLGSNELSR